MSGILMEFVNKRWPYEHEDHGEDDEPAYIGIRLDKDGHLIQWNQVDNYMHRSTALKSLCFYDFVHHFSVISKGAKPDAELLENFTVTDRITKFPILSRVPIIKNTSDNRTHFGHSIMVHDEDCT